jgi:hypothetical protein
MATLGLPGGQARRVVPSRPGVPSSTRDRAAGHGEREVEIPRQRAADGDIDGLTETEIKGTTVEPDEVVGDIPFDRLSEVMERAMAGELSTDRRVHDVRLTKKGKPDMRTLGSRELFGTADVRDALVGSNRAASEFAVDADDPEFSNVPRNSDGVTIDRTTREGRLAAARLRLKQRGSSRG